MLTWDEAGHRSPADVSLRIPVYVAESRGAALSEPVESFMRQFRRLGGQLATSTASPGADDAQGRAERAEQLASLSWEQVQREKVAVGTPEMVVERIQRAEGDPATQRRRARVQRRRVAPAGGGLQIAQAVL